MTDIRVVTLYLRKLLVIQVELADDLAQVELVDPLQVVMQDFVGAFNRFVDSSETFHGPS